MTGFWKDDLSSFANRGFMWSAQVDFKINVPEANWAGTVMTGCIPMSEINGKSDISLQTLISISNVDKGKKIANQHVFTLKSAIVNHSIALTDRIITLTSDSVPEDFKQELFCWAIIKTPGISISTGATTVYTVDYEVRGNAIFVPKLESPIANKLYQTPPLSVADVTLPKVAMPPYNPEHPLPSW